MVKLYYKQKRKGDDFNANTFNEGYENYLSWPI